MKVIVIKVGEKKISKHGGSYRRVIFRGVEDNKSYFLDVYDSHTLSRRWIPFIKSQAVFDNVSIFKDNIISGNSNFRYIGQRHEKV